MTADRMSESRAKDFQHRLRTVSRALADAAADCGHWNRDALRRLNRMQGEIRSMQSESDRRLADPDLLPEAEQAERGRERRAERRNQLKVTNGQTQQA